MLDKLLETRSQIVGVVPGRRMPLSTKIGHRLTKFGAMFRRGQGWPEPCQSWPNSAKDGRVGPKFGISWPSVVDFGVRRSEITKNKTTSIFRELSGMCPSSVPRVVQRRAIWRAGFEHFPATPDARRGSILFSMLETVSKNGIGGLPGDSPPPKKIAHKMPCYDGPPNCSLVGICEFGWALACAHAD